LRRFEAAAVHIYTWEPRWLYGRYDPHNTPAYPHLTLRQVTEFSIFDEADVARRHEQRR
jgi:hypothetical protein